MTFVRIAAMLLLVMSWAEPGGAGENISLLDLESKVVDGIPVGWKLNRKAGRPNIWITEIDGVKAVCLRSEVASFSIQRPIHIDLRQTPVLRWTWLARELPPDGDVRKSETNDQAAQLFVGFHGLWICPVHHVDSKTLIHLIPSKVFLQAFRG